MNKPHTRPRKSTKKRGAFKMTPSRVKAAKAAREINRRVREKLYGPAADIPTDEEFMRV